KKRLSTEKVEWMKGLQGEVLAVLLRGDVVGPHSVPTGVAGPFLNRLHELTQSVAGVLVGRQSGRRGPLREVPGAGLLALGGVEWGRSAALHFIIGPGEQFQLYPEDPLWSITGEAVGVMVDLVEASAKRDQKGLYEVTRELGPRVGTNFENLVEVLVHR